jgi:hypothetical protein
VTKIGELGTTQAATSNRRMLRRNTKFLQEPHGVTTQKTPFVLAVTVSEEQVIYIVRDENDEEAKNIISGNEQLKHAAKNASYC